MELRGRFPHVRERVFSICFDLLQYNGSITQQRMQHFTQTLTNGEDLYDDDRLIFASVNQNESGLMPVS